jgi:carbon monoxide dehydrogenase subunit G
VRRRDRALTTISRTFAVSPAPAVVLDYLKDFGHTVEWDPGTEQCTRNDSGPIEVGASWHNVSKIAGIRTELTYTLDRLSDDTIVFVGRNETASTTDSITVRPHDGGSKITYRAQIDMHGAARLAAPAVKLIFEKVGNDTQKQLTAVLNRLAR